MKLRVSIVFLLLLSAPVWGKSEKKITYVGDGRYVCSGSRCDEFDARERKYQDKHDRERRQNDQDDERERRYREHESGDYRKRSH